jgi:O-antigen ligase
MLAIDKLTRRGSVDNTLGSRWTIDEGWLAAFLRPGTIAAVLVTISGVAAAYALTTFSLKYALVLLVGLAVVLIVFIEPFLGLLMVVFTVPMEDYFQIPGLPISLMKLVGLLAMGAVVLHFIAFRRQQILVRAPQNGPLFAFMGAVLLSGLLGMDDRTVLKDAFRLSRVLTIYPMAIYLIDSPRALRRVLWIMCIAGFICSVVGINDFYAWRTTHEHDLRISGTMHNTNEFAATMILIALVAIHLWRSEKSSLRRWILIIMSGTIVYAVTLTASRGAMLALGVSIVILVLQQRNRVQTLFVLVIFAAIVLLVMPTSARERIGLTADNGASADELTISSRDASTRNRMSYQVLGMRLFLQRPVTGIGLGNFGNAYDRSEFRWLNEQTETGQRSREAHNMYLEILVGTGLMGMLPFMSLLYFTIRDFIRTCRNLLPNSSLKFMSQGLLAGFGAFLAASLFLSEQYEKYFWLLIALAPVVLRLAQSSEERISYAGP